MVLSENRNALYLYKNPMKKPRQRVLLAPQISIEMWTRQNGKCVYCNRTMIVRDKWLQPTIEHIIPRDKGGADHHTNYCLACFKCNNWRGNMPVDQFLDGYRYWCQHNGDLPSTHEARKVR
jgi:5-methylcytosine-specific restriction endonuclease McrA